MTASGTPASGRRGRGNGHRNLRRSLPVALLGLSLLVAGFGALEAYRAQRSHQETATELLRDYSEFAAWSYERSSWDLLRLAIEGHLAIAHSNLAFAQGHATEQCLGMILDPPEGPDGCACGIEMAGDYSLFTRLGDPASASLWAGAAPDLPHQRTVVDAVQRHARDGYRESWPFAVLHVDTPDGLSIVAYTLVLEAPTELAVELDLPRDTVIYGFQVDPDRISDLYAQVLNDQPLLPPTLTQKRPNGELINVQVVGPDEKVLYESTPGAAMAFAAPVPRQEIFGGGEIRASVPPAVAGELIIGGLPGDRTGILVLVFSLAGALAVLAILQLRREDRLALLRQDFVASVSHELRTPLAQVRLFTETLRLGRTKTREQRDWALENIDRETRRLSSLVENILHFSRGERGVPHAEQDPGDVALPVREAVASYLPLLPERKGTLAADLPDGLMAEIHGDSIRQVILNLIDNAVRYGRDGQTIRVTGRRTGRAIRIDVDDEGPGVPAPDRERIFEPFHRGDQSLGTVVVGSGIGLAVVRQLIEAHEGRVWVEDAPGGGARFSFELPALHTALSTHFPKATAAPRRDSGAA